MKRELERIEVPGEDAAQERAWNVIQAAFADRLPVERTPRRLRPVIALAVVLTVVAAALSPPGRAVIDEIREAVGVEHAQPALFSLPAPGKLLVASDEGVWVVQEDGSRRLLGDFREASWSPFGRFVVAAGQNELAALEPDGDVRWTLARPGVRSPRWAGTETDTRIAYLGGRQPRVVAGDGSGDQPVCAVSARQIPPAWRPGPGFALALVPPSGTVHLVDLDGCVSLWFSAQFRGPRRLEWSSDGTRLLLVTTRGIRVLDADSGSLVRGERAADATFRPGTRELALIRPRGEASEVLVGNRVVFRGPGTLQGLTWSPDGSWVLVGWPAADQWVFVRTDGRGIRAVSNVSEQFRSRSFPRVEGWCCAG